MQARVLVTGGSGFIGSHLTEELLHQGVAVLSVDIRAPQLSDHQKVWRSCDIKDRAALSSVFLEFAPTHVIHLAAKANLRGNSIEDFPDNTVGTDNVVFCVNETDSVELLVNTSTQYVVRPGVEPPDFEFLLPYTAYGASKAAAEKIVRERCLRRWVTIRPTNIWGERHPFFPYELWKYLENGYFVHPGFAPINKHYGYVKNAVKQVMKVAFGDVNAIGSGRVWYVTDGAIDNYEWMNQFSIRLAGRKVRRLPMFAWRAMAKIGDMLRAVGVKFPVGSDRLFRLTVHESLPESMVLKLGTEERVPFPEGVARCVDWYRRANLPEVIA